MKYTIAGFQQKVLMDYGLGIDEAEILRCIVDFWFSHKMETRDYDGKEFFYLSYGFIAGELPILGVDRKQIANKMKRFVDCGLMEYRVEKKGNGSKVYFTINEDFYLPLVEIPAAENAQAPKRETVAAVVQEKDDKKAIRAYYSWLYLLKAKEITGSDTTAEGRKIVLPWGAKEASLLLKDYGVYGLEGLQRFIRLFFSDSIPEVANFTRGFRKAGYSYSVFHGSLPKLAPVQHDVAPPCPECGQWKGHLGTCSIEKNYVAAYRRDAEEKEKIHEEHPELLDIDLVAMFDKQVRLKDQQEESCPTSSPSPLSPPILP